MSIAEKQNSQLIAILGTGSKTSNELQRLLDVSQTTLSRIVRRNRAGLLTLGAARSTRYALCEPLDDLGSEVPVFTVNIHGDISPYGTLHILAANQYGWQVGKDKPQLLDHLPYLVQNMKPEGFMGRAFAHTYAAELGLPDKLQSWGDRQVVAALAQKGEDFTGNLIVGKKSVERYLLLARAKSVDIIQPEDRAGVYSELAEKAIAGDRPGSSAGGEQPKFTALLQNPDDSCRVIVKFAGRRSDEGRRWSDLLVCEHLAANLLNEAGFNTASTEILQTDDWTFLQSDRFDRAGKWGRLPLVSLDVIMAEYIGYGENWADCAEQLAEEHLICERDHERIRWLSAFGTMIGNTDMHLGNISLFPRDHGFEPAPIYDMSPMIYRPRTGGVLFSGEIEPGLVDMLINLDEVRSIAIRCWKSIGTDERISEGFRALCSPNIGVLENIGRGPRMIL